MAKCPICETQYTENQVETFTVCGYDLTSLITTAIGEPPPSVISNTPLYWRFPLGWSSVEWSAYLCWKFGQSSGMQRQKGGARRFVVQLSRLLSLCLPRLYWPGRQQLRFPGVLFPPGDSSPLTILPCFTVISVIRYASLNHKNSVFWSRKIFHLRISTSITFTLWNYRW